MSLIKKFSMLLIVLILLAACGANSSDVEGTTSPEVQNTNNQGENFGGDFATNALSPVAQLAVGTLMLEDTDLAVDANLAATLVPYWKLYLVLVDSDSTAPQELDGLINDIQDAMTAEQISYIAGLKLTQQDMMTLMNDLGIMEDLRTNGSGQGTGYNRPEGMPEGFQPGQGAGTGGRPGGGTGGEGFDPEVMATMQARREEMGASGNFAFGSDRLITPLVNTLISTLEEKTGN